MPVCILLDNQTHLEQAGLVPAAQSRLAQAARHQLAVVEADPAVPRAHVLCLAAVVLLFGLKVDKDPAQMGFSEV